MGFQSRSRLIPVRFRPDWVGVDGFDNASASNSGFDLLPAVSEYSGYSES
jgi:hypothetical protein